jgi:hypothetical protein
MSHSSPIAIGSGTVAMRGESGASSRPGDQPAERQAGAHRQGDPQRQESVQGGQPCYGGGFLCDDDRSLLHRHQPID